MFRIVRFDLLIRYIVLSTVAISVAIYFFIQAIFFPDLSLVRITAISSFVSAILVFLLLTPFFARKIWQTIGRFDKTIFPDLNGTWEGEVATEKGDFLIVRAVIRQTLLSTQIDMHGETTKSITLETTPINEQGQKKLYYMYRSTPKNPCWPTYIGSTVFDVRRVDIDGRICTELSGVYYTDRKSIGRIRLRQICFDSGKDVSFY